jgi:hypothetical protein
VVSHRDQSLLDRRFRGARRISISRVSSTPTAGKNLPTMFGNRESEQAADAPHGKVPSSLDRSDRLVAAGPAESMQCLLESAATRLYLRRNT